MRIGLPAPDEQIGFCFALDEARGRVLQEALRQAVGRVPIATLDGELGCFVPPEQLGRLARHGLRGELLFAVPCILKANPQLIGYYRLLLGYSRKLFYNHAKTGIVGAFARMEDHAEIGPEAAAALDSLCTELVRCAVLLLDGIGVSRMSQSLVHELTLLTFGPLLRGSRNTRLGVDAGREVRSILADLVRDHAAFESENRIILKNAAGRDVVIQFGDDPDVTIREALADGVYRNVIAIEVKGGTDYSNIHNRLGEAEKSHQKAKQAGFTERWTIYNVDGLDPQMARDESPSTDRFFRLSVIRQEGTPEYAEFRHRVAALAGIPFQ